ncbi:MAG: GNAT family N-acetyltransferase [Candidatus Zixiibacteriota bacterium]
MDYPIRHLDVSDYDVIIALWSRAGLKYRPKGRDSREAMSHEFARAETCFLGMFDGDTMIGVIVGTSDGRKGWLNRLAIDPDYRGRGLAAHLIKAAEDFLRGFGIKVLAGLIEDWNTPSLSAFKKAGYRFYDDIVYCSKRTSEDD